MGRVDRRRAQRPLDYGSNLIVVDGSRAARAGLVEQAITTIDAVDVDLQMRSGPFVSNWTDIPARPSGDS